jgi:hypothetical protein
MCSKLAKILSTEINELKRKKNCKIYEVEHKSPQKQVMVIMPFQKLLLLSNSFQSQFWTISEMVTFLGSSTVDDYDTLIFPEGLVGENSPRGKLLVKMFYETSP